MLWLEKCLAASASCTQRSKELWPQWTGVMPVRFVMEGQTAPSASCLAWWLRKRNECLRRWLQQLLCRVPFLDNTRFEYSMFGGFSCHEQMDICIRASSYLTLLYFTSPHLPSSRLTLPHVFSPHLPSPYLTRLRLTLFTGPPASSGFPDTHYKGLRHRPASMSIYILLVGLRADRPRLAGSCLSVFERVSHRRCLIVAASPVPFRCHPSPNCF